MKRILMIGTGGTIASGMTEDGLAPELTPEQLLHYVPGISSLCKVDCLSLFSLDSTNVNGKHWVILAGLIREHYSAYDGFVICHGTDTMAYTASALSYMLENLTKPVIFTGSQLPIGQLRTDGKENLITSIEIAATKDAEGRDILMIEPQPDFVIFPDEDGQKMVRSRQYEDDSPLDKIINEK